MTEWKKLIGKRCLVKQRFRSWSRDLTEVRVIEVAPSGELVKLKFISDFERWVSVDEYTVVEVLGGCWRLRRVPSGDITIGEWFKP